MQLLDTYLKSVARFLPAAERDDIVRELSENLRSQIEDREAQIGRPLTGAEVQAILDQFGSPLEVAGRYQQNTRVLAFGRVLVGPVLFPFYTKVLGMKLLRTTDRPEQKYTLAFVGYGSNPDHAELELTYNYGVEKYELGTAYGHLAIGVDDVYAACDRIRAAGGAITREPGPVKGGTTVIAFVQDPDGYKIELIQGRSV